MIDVYHLRKALQLAKIQRGFCAPNPSVGSVILNQENQIIATGYHQGAGLAHAEIEALKNITTCDKPHTLYVTLEPCCHFGKTPPCTDAIIQANIKRVVYGYKDPHHVVNGQGADILKKAGIACEHLKLPEIEAFYQSYDHWQKTKMPFVTAKIAMSMNGKIAKKNGQSLQITGFELSQKTHSHRKMSDAILTTAETILKDDPQLNVRIDGQTYKKPIYILDRKLKLGEDAQIFTTASSITIFHASTETPPSNNNSIRYIPISTTHDGLNLNIAIQHIGKDGIHDLWVEAGGKCFSALIEAKLVNKAFIYIAPCWIVDGKTAFNKLNLQDLQDKNLQWQPCGKDVFCEIHW